MPCPNRICHLFLCSKPSNVIDRPENKKNNPTIPSDVARDKTICQGESASNNAALNAANLLRNNTVVNTYIETTVMVPINAPEVVLPMELIRIFLRTDLPNRIFR